VPVIWLGIARRRSSFPDKNAFWKASSDANGLSVRTYRFPFECKMFSRLAEDRSTAYYCNTVAASSAMNSTIFVHIRQVSGACPAERRAPVSPLLKLRLFSWTKRLLRPAFSDYAHFSFPTFIVSLFFQCEVRYLSTPYSHVTLPILRLGYSGRFIRPIVCA